MSIEEKEEFLYQNINYILAPYYLFTQKSGVISIDNKRIKKLSLDLIILLTNYLVDDDNEIFKEYVTNLKNNKDFMKKYQNNIYLSLRKQNNGGKYYHMILILDSVKKYLNKDNTNYNKLIILQKYYQLEKNRRVS